MRTQLLVLGAALSALSLSPRPAAAEPDAGLRVQVVGLRSDAGHVRCLAFDRDAGFPKRRDGAKARAVAAIRDRKAVCEFPGLPAGDYALSFIHDEDDDDELDTNFFGIPTEGYGFGNDARGSMGPPDYDEAVMTYAGGAQTIRLKVAY